MMHPVAYLTITTLPLKKQKLHLPRHDERIGGARIGARQVERLRRVGIVVLHALEMCNYILQAGHGKVAGELKLLPSRCRVERVMQASHLQQMEQLYFTGQQGERG